MILDKEKIENYESIIKIVKAVISPDDCFISNLANLAAILKEKLNPLWVGFYLIDAAKNQLYLGPFQGPLACSRIAYGKGVCGTSFRDKKTIIVPNVHEFAGHIACSSLSNSEIVIPVFHQTKIVAILDIDSVNYRQFDETDQAYLEKITTHLGSCYHQMS